MLGKIMKAALVGFVALLFVQGGAFAATINYVPNSTTDEVDEELAVSSGTFDTFSASPTHHALTNFTDYYLVGVTGPVDTLSLVLNGFGSDDTTPLNKSDFALTLSQIGVGDNLLDGSIDLTLLVPEGTGNGAGLFVNGLATGFYLLQVDYASGTAVDGYSGRITATPLPPALLIFGTGLFGLGFLSRYRRKRQGQLGLQV
jgi:hypothetical protein